MSKCEYMSKQSIDPSRRGFLTGALLTREGKQKIKRKIQRLGLIPPGLNAAISSGHCQSCEGLCQNSCLQKIIKLHPSNHDLKGQPFLDFSDDGCTFCYDCNTACPEISNDVSANKQIKLGKAWIDQSQCYAWSGIICMSCKNVCPDNLIRFTLDRKVSIEHETCTGCGMCVRICPATAIKVKRSAI